MILFKTEHVPLIKSREKTQTRRKWKRCRVKVGSVHQAKTDFKKGSRPFAHIKIIGYRREELGQMTEADAKREGYPSIEAYMEAYERIYGKWIPEEEVWVADFELAN